MRLLTTTAVATAALLAFGATAQAADAIMPAPTPTMPVVDDSGFDWSGFYAGVALGGQGMVDDVNSGDDDIDDLFDGIDLTLGARAGYNVQFDSFVLGVEGGIDAVFIGDDFDDADGYGTILARGGMAFDSLLAYGAVGFGTDFEDDQIGYGDHVLVGGGLEFAATDSISIDGRYLYGFSTEDDEVFAGTDQDIHKFTIGANFHF